MPPLPTSTHTQLLSTLLSLEERAHLHSTKPQLLAMPVKPWSPHHHAVHELLTCCALMLALAHPVTPSSRSAAVTAPAAPTTPPPPPTVQSPASVATPPAPSVPVTPIDPATDPNNNKHVWIVQYIMWAPDCKQRGMIGINGTFPGPTIKAKKGELVTVVVHNKLHTEGVVIHWHGIRQVVPRACLSF